MLEYLIRITEWNENQIYDQLQAARRFINYEENCIVIVILNDDEYIGFALGQFYAWDGCPKYRR